MLAKARPYRVEVLRWSKASLFEVTYEVSWPVGSDHPNDEVREAIIYLPVKVTTSGGLDKAEELARGFVLRHLRNLVALFEDEEPANSPST